MVGALDGAADGRAVVGALDGETDGRTVLVGAALDREVAAVGEDLANDGEAVKEEDGETVGALVFMGGVIEPESCAFEAQVQSR